MNNGYNKKENITEDKTSLNNGLKSREIPSHLLAVRPRWFVEPFEEESRFIPPPRISGKCTGCGTCEAICSFTHFEVASNALSAIHVINNDMDWIQGRSSKIIKIDVCRQCPGLSPCMAVCPKLAEGALFRDKKTSAVLVDADECIRCGACIRACPYDSMSHSPRLDAMIKCDLCGGEPKCVEWCPPKVLRYVKE